MRFNCLVQHAVARCTACLLHAPALYKGTLQDCMRLLREGCVSLISCQEPIEQISGQPGG